MSPDKNQNSFFNDNQAKDLEDHSQLLKEENNEEDKQ